MRTKVLGTCYTTRMSDQKGLLVATMLTKILSHIDAHCPKRPASHYKWRSCLWQGGIINTTTSTHLHYSYIHLCNSCLLVKQSSLRHWIGLSSYSFRVGQLTRVGQVTPLIPSKIVWGTTPKDIFWKFKGLALQDLAWSWVCVWGLMGSWRLNFRPNPVEPNLWISKKIFLGWFLIQFCLELEGWLSFFGQLTHSNKYRNFIWQWSVKATT